MTEPQAASSAPGRKGLGRVRKGLGLARKGLAVPAGSANQLGLAEPGATMDREASTGTFAPLPAGEAAPIPNPEAARGRETGTGPAASLLPFDFLGARGASFDPARLPRAEPEVTLGLPAEPPAEPSTAPPAAPPAPAPSATAAKSNAPPVDPSWRIGQDPKPARPARSHARPALAAVLAVAAVLGLGWHADRVGWLDFEAGTAARVEAPNETTTQGAPGAASPVAEKTVPEKTVESAATSAPAPALVPALAPATAPSGADADAGPAPEAVPPSIDVVRVEPDGAAVIAGRAAPGAELIVLDNGTPIGTAKADAFGEWVFIPDAPLPAGAHEFGLVVKRVQGGVTLPAAGDAGDAGDAGGAEEQGPAGDAPAPSEVEPEEAGRGHDDRATGSERGPRAQAPVPVRKPAAGAAAQENGADFPGADFVVQLASVKTRAGAEREWRALRRRFPKLLGDMRLSLDKAKLAGGVTVVRLRTGAFADARAAAALCKRLAAKRQDCLVVRAAAGG